MPFLKIDDRDTLFGKLEEYYNNFEDYSKLVKYLKNNWLNNKYINYYNLEKKEYLNHTNNYIERFHGIINQTL